MWTIPKTKEEAEAVVEIQEYLRQHHLVSPQEKWIKESLTIQVRMVSTNGKERPKNYRINSTIVLLERSTSLSRVWRLNPNIMDGPT